MVRDDGILACIIYSFLVLRLFVNLSEPEGSFCPMNVFQSPTKLMSFSVSAAPSRTVLKMLCNPHDLAKGLWRYLKNITVMLITLN